MNFTDYQKIGEGSKFWGRGKWDNYVLPHLPQDPRDMIYVDMGCNVGLFVKYAKELGFKRSIGIDVNPEVIERGIVAGHGELIYGEMQKAIDDLPVCDCMSFINSHYHLLVKDWLDMLPVIQKKARYVIITAIRKRRYTCMASGLRKDIIKFFKHWNQVNYIEQLPFEGDPCPRSLATFCFENPELERVPMNKLKKGNQSKDKFYIELERGVMPLETIYFKKLVKQRGEIFKKELVEHMYRKIDLYEDIKKNGIKEPLIVDENYTILDGNYRKEMWEYLGHETIITRKL